jgi:hypothetical protein
MATTPKTVAIEAAGAGHIGVVVRALFAAGWLPSVSPAGGRLLRNRQKIVLSTPAETRRLRVLVFKVTRSSRGREHERRVEITSTYGHGIDPSREFDDVVLGYDPENEVFVGLDPERLRHGGPTSNASSFLEVSGLRRTAIEPFIVLLRSTRIFPKGEHQAFFRPERLSEYLFNVSAIHAGSYPGRGRGLAQLFRGGRWKQKSLGKIEKSLAVGDTLVLERADPVRTLKAALTKRALALVDQPAAILTTRKITPEELRSILARQEQNGWLGEEIVFNHEQEILQKVGLSNLANQVNWVSRRSIGEGFDIASFDPVSREPRYIEVKSCEGALSSFEVTANEWKKAASLGEDYFVYCVSNVRTGASVHVLRDPCRLEKDGSLRRDGSSWRVKTDSAKRPSCHARLDSWPGRR